MRQINSYAVEEVPIGSGGMGKVLKGYTPDNRPVAIKEILPQYVTNIEYRSRIESEIRFLKGLHHENVVKVFDHFEEGGNLYIVMELVEGQDLEQYIASHGRIEWKDALNYMVKLLDTLQYVHERGIVHRDIKPGNIMVRPDGRVCLLDFGVAKDVTSNHGGTVFGTVIGTDGYMSPEQANGMSIDSRSDIYALGCVLYYMLCGRHAYEKMGSDHETQFNIINKPFPRIADAVQGIPASVQKVLDGATDKNMMKRYQSCREFRDQILRTMPNGTSVNSSVNSATAAMSIGRENCDLCVGTDNYKVSRHHADVTLKVFTGGTYYVYRDCSTNGTVINGQSLRNGDVYNIREGENPEIFLANDLTCRVNFIDIVNLLRDKVARLGEMSRESGERNGDLNAEKGDSATDAPASSGKIGFLDAVKICLKKYADFKGRASRAEYWWFALLNFLVSFTLGLLYILSDFKVEFVVMQCVAGLGLLLPGLAVTIRRLHDVGSGWKFYLLCLLGCIVPILNFVCLIMLLVKLCTRGDDFPNKYGIEP